MPTCCVIKCPNGSSSANSCRSFNFPPETSPALRKEWLERINRQGYQITDNSRVCELHFAAEAYIPESENKDAYGRQRKKSRLKPLAYPTLNLKSPAEEESKKRLSWRSCLSDDHHYAKPPKIKKTEAAEAIVPQEHDHSYKTLTNLVEVNIYCCYLNYDHTRKYPPQQKRIMF